MNVSLLFRRFILGAGLALAVAGMAVSAVGAQPSDGGSTATPGQTSITTDKTSYTVGEPITITYTLPAPGRYRITDHQGGQVSTLRSGFSAQAKGTIRGTVTPPVGKECLKLEYTDSKNQTSSAETCFQVTEKAGPDQPKDPDQPQGQTPAPGLYTLRNKFTDLLLSNDPDKKVFPKGPNQGAFQVWMIEAGPDGFVFLRDAATSNYLESDGSRNVYTQVKSGGTSQQWKVEPAGDGHFMLRNRETGYALDNDPVSGSIIATLPLAGLESGPRMLWKLTAAQP